MKVILLHESDYARELANGAKPWRREEQAGENEVRVACDPFFPVPKGERFVLDTVTGPRIEGGRLVCGDR